MSKSKPRKNRRRGPAPTVQSLATRKAGRNFVAMVSKKATEGTVHRLTIQLEEGKTSTTIDTSGERAQVADATVTDFILTCLTMDVECAISLETLHETGGSTVRMWVIHNNKLTPMTADELSGALEDIGTTDEQANTWRTDDTVVLQNAYSLVD